MRRTLSVRLSVCPSVPLSLPSVTSRHLANYNDTHVLLRHALRAAYRTAISAAQILVTIIIPQWYKVPLKFLDPGGDLDQHKIHSTPPKIS